MSKFARNDVLYKGKKKKIRPTRECIKEKNEFCKISSVSMRRKLCSVLYFIPPINVVHIGVKNIMTKSIQGQRTLFIPYHKHWVERKEQRLRRWKYYNTFLFQYMSSCWIFFSFFFFFELKKKMNEVWKWCKGFKCHWIRMPLKQLSAISSIYDFDCQNKPSSNGKSK